MRVLAFLLGVAVGWVLVRRREPMSPPCECWAGTGWEDWEDDKPTTAYKQAVDGYMHMGWMQADGTWTWSGARGYDG